MMLNPQPLILKSIPSNVEMEQAVLGGLLLDPATLYRVASIIQPSDFYLEKHRLIYDVLADMERESKPIDFLTVVAELEKREKLTAIGGAAYLTALINCVPTGVYTETHAREVANLAGKRRLIAAAGEIAGWAYDGYNYSDAFSLAQNAVLKCAPQISGGPVSDSATGIADTIMKIRLRTDEPCEVAGVRTGYFEWDKRFGGLQPGLHVIEGRTSSGKTWLMLGIADGAANYGTGVLIVSLEMTAEQIHYRRISRYARTRIKALRTGLIWDDQNKRKFSSTDIQKIEDAGLKASELNVSIATPRGATASDLRALIMAQVRKNKIGLVMVDYAQKIKGLGRQRRDLELGDAAEILQDTANDLNIPLLLGSQVHRRGNDDNTRFLTIEDIRESGEIGEVADVIYGLSSPDYGKQFELGYKRKNILEVACLKDRLGDSAGKLIHLAVIEETGSIENGVSDAH